MLLDASATSGTPAGGVGRDVYRQLEAQGLTFLSAEVQMIPQNTVVPADEETLQKVQKLLEMLEDNDDVQNVWHNAELPEEPDEE